jgi:hypothetical protein
MKFYAILGINKYRAKTFQPFGTNRSTQCVVKKYVTVMHYSGIV